jgi:hypothetical protein
MVVTVHDVSFAATRSGSRRKEGFRRRLTTRLAARRARAVLTVSDFSKREIVRCFGIDPAKVDVVYSGATPFRATVSRASRPRSVLDPQPRTGARAVRRLGLRAAACSRAHRRLRAPGARAARGDAGYRRRQPQPAAVDLAALVHAADVDGRIRLRDYVSDAELAALYSGPRAFAFLSEYEGFGLTPLDALAAGVPIVVLDTEVAREIYGPAAVYVPSPDPALVEAALEAVIFDPRGPRERCSTRRPPCSTLLLARVGAADAAGAARRGGALTRAELAIVIVTFNFGRDIAACLAACRPLPARRRTRSWSWTTPRRTARRAGARRHPEARSSTRAAISASRAPTTSGSAPPAASWCCCSTPTRSRAPAPSTRWSAC